MSTARLNGLTCMRAVAHLPAWGLPWFDVVLDAEHTIEAGTAATLEIADATFSCTVATGGPWIGRSTFRLVGGAGGWCKPLPAQAYRNAAGVKISKVITDAATSAGERVEGVPAGTLGPAWDRFAGAASQTLQLATPRAWRVDPDGVTRFGAPPSRELDVTAARGRVDRAAGRVELMADSIAGIVPGLVVEGITAVDVVHTIEAGKLRSVVWGSPLGASKRAAAYERIVSSLFPWLRYAGVWEYRVVQQVGDTLDLQPARASLPVPDLEGVAVRPGLPGAKGTALLGSLVLVIFANNDPSRPCVIAFDAADAAGFGAGRLDLSSSDELGVVDPAGRVVRYGDTFWAPLGTAGTPTAYQLSATGLTPAVLVPPFMPASRVRG